MSSTSLTKTDFDHEVAGLLRLRQQVAATLRPAVDAILKFANAYRTLHTRIGPNYERRVELRKRLGLDEYQHQRMMAIAAQSKTLNQFSRALPPAVEPLYEIARLTKDAAGEKRVRRAVEKHELTPTSGIRDIRAIRQSTQRRSAKPRATNAAVERRAPSSLAFVIDGDEGLTSEVIEQFKAELVTLVEKYGLQLRTKDEMQNRRAKEQQAVHGEADEDARLARIFAMPPLNRVIRDDDLTEVPADHRAALNREVLECYERHRATWTTIPADADWTDERVIKEYFEKEDGRAAENHAFFWEVLEIAARHGVPRAIAALKGEMSPEVRKTYAMVKPILERDRAEREEREGSAEQQKRRRRPARDEGEPQ